MKWQYKVIAIVITMIVLSILAWRLFFSENGDGKQKKRKGTSSGHTRHRGDRHKHRHDSSDEEESPPHVKSGKMEVSDRSVKNQKHEGEPSTPDKKKWKREELCRQWMEHLTGEKFPCIRPDILKNPETLRNLEFDGYCEKLKIAFEHHGIQHYKYPNGWHKTHKDYEQQVRRDEYKKDVCDQHKISLIIVPYTIPEHKLESYVRAKLVRAGCDLKR